MAKVFEHIDEQLRAFTEAQPMFFVAAASRSRPANSAIRAGIA